MSYDIIGDTHGCAESLIALLEKMGYRKADGVYCHPSRKVIFLGDFIDRGPHQRKVIEIARSMVESEAAMSVMGNHEFNAIAFHTPNAQGDGYLRPHNDKNIGQHQAFLDAYQNSLDDYAEVIAWFQTLPLWLDLDGLRAVHACWDWQWINRIHQSQNGGCHLSSQLLIDASQKGTWQYEAIETLLKGKEIPLAYGLSFCDKDGNERHNIRVRWWDQLATTYKDAFLGPESARTHIPDDEIQGDHLVDYSHTDVPVFLGHYWMEGEPHLLATNIACLDFSAGKPGGRLVAYRWDGEQTLSEENFVWIDRLE